MKDHLFGIKLSGLYNMVAEASKGVVNKSFSLVSCLAIFLQHKFTLRDKLSDGCKTPGNVSCNLCWNVL